MRIGLIGLGRIGAFHAETLSKLPSVTSLVVTDAVPAAARAVAERLDVELADSPDKLLAAGVDGVIIAAATDAHPDLLIAAADAGLPVFCEKPVARTMSEGVAVARRVAATGVAGPDRLPPPLRRRVHRRPRGGGERRTGLAAHRTFDDA